MNELRELSGYINGTNTKLSVGVFSVIIKNGNVLMVQTVNRDKWECPGGHLYDGETMQEGTIRETKEETGYNVILKGKPLYYLYKLNENLNVMLFYYLAEIVSGEMKPIAKNICNIKWFDIDNIPKNVFENVPVVIKMFR